MERALKHPRILVIDDDDAICVFFEKVLPGEGYEVASTLDVKTGMDLVKNMRPDIILIDLNMPEIDGIEGVRRLKEVNRESVIILITGYGAMDTARKAMMAGAYDYITKPFDIDILMDTIKDGLASARKN